MAGAVLVEHAVPSDESLGIDEWGKFVYYWSVLVSFRLQFCTFFQKRFQTNV